MWKVIAVSIVAVALALYITKRTCTLKCGAGVHRENMTAGLGTINALSMYNNSSHCYGANAMGSTDPFCTTTGYVLT